MEIVTFGIAAFAVTSVAGTIRRGINDRREAKMKRLAGPEPVCGCTHHLSFHDLATGQCHAQVVVKVHDEDGESRKTRETCTCRRYVGPEPLTTYYTPEISGVSPLTPDRGELENRPIAEG